MNITIVQPLEAQGWTTDNTMLEQLVNKGGVTSAELSKIAVPGKEDEARLKSLEQTFTKHDKLQVVADPTYLKAMPMRRKSTASRNRPCSTSPPIPR